MLLGLPTRALLKAEKSERIPPGGTRHAPTRLQVPFTISHRLVEVDQLTATYAAMVPFCSCKPEDSEVALNPIQSND